MGWSSWNTYRVNISDSLIMKQADAIIRHCLANLCRHAWLADRMLRHDVLELRVLKNPYLCKR
jgi:hypothetical protein